MLTTLTIFLRRQNFNQVSSSLLSLLLLSTVNLLTPIPVRAATAGKINNTEKRENYLNYQETIISQSTKVPMRLQHGEGAYVMTVPNFDTSQSAYGGKLRFYDVHIAKMFEVTYKDCQEINAGSRSWYYYAGNGNINMGEFLISCDLASQVVSKFGLAQAEETVVEYSQEEAGPPISKVRYIPILDITGTKVEEWLDFVQRFPTTNRHR